MLLIFVLLGVSAVVAVIGWIGQQIVGPIDRAARGRQASLQYGMLDFLALFLLIQIPMGLVQATINRDEAFAYWVLSGLGFVVSVLIWHAGLSAVSRAGVPPGTGRALLLGFVLPVVFYGSIAFVLIGVAGVIMVFESNDVQRWWDFWPLIPLQVVLLMALVVARRITRSVLKEVPAMDEPMAPAASHPSGETVFPNQ